MRVLYICTGNSFRSPVAEALTRKFHPDIEVESAGTDRADHIAGNARRFLKEESALRYVKPSPEQVSERALSEADRVVAMMPEHREFIKEKYGVGDQKIEVWNIRDPINPGIDPGEAFSSIRRNVRDEIP